MLRRQIAFFDPRQHIGRRLPPDFKRRKGVGCQGRLHVGGQFVVFKANHRNIFRYANAFPVQRMDATRRHRIVHGKDGRWPRGGAEQLLGFTVAGLKAPIAIMDIALGNRQLRIVHGLAVAVHIRMVVG